MLWQNESFYAIGMDRSTAMIDRARATAAAWDLEERAFFQVGDARKMRLKTAYFDLVISDSSLHVFDDPVSVLREINRVLKPKGGLLIRDFQRPSRLEMRRKIAEYRTRYGSRLGRHVETALRASFTRMELHDMIRTSGLERVHISEDENYLLIERTGESDPNSWIKVREQYL
jgi:ubiquinone/menaquinone biosynthesis C-methylase UbiE